MLAVVQHQQEVGVGQGGDEAFDGVRGLALAAAGVEHALADAEGVEHLAGQVPAVAQPAEVHEGDTAGVAAGGLDGEAGLPGAAGADDGDQAGAATAVQRAEEPGDPFEFVAAADEGGELGGRPGPPYGGGLRRGGGGGGAGGGGSSPRSTARCTAASSSEGSLPSSSARVRRASS